MNVNQVVRTITIRGESQGVDELTGKVNKLADAQQNVAVVSEQSARRVLSLEDAWKKQTLKLDEAARSQANIARESKIADGALREGLITQQQHADRLELISQRYTTAGAATQKFVGQTGLARHELINLSRQAQDVVVSLGSGQGLGTVLLQQGSQIADVFASSTSSVRGFASQAIGWLGRFATSAAGAATGAVAIGAGAVYAASSWADAQREIDRSLIGLGRRAGVTANEINQIARGGATATGLSVDQARDAALEFVKTGAIYRDNIKAAVAVTQDFAIVTGKDAKDAAKDLGAALADPLQGADALNAKLGFLDGRTREYIATLVSQNQKQEAQAVLLRNLAPAIQDATNTLGPLEKAWNAVANAAIGAKNAIGAALTPRTTEQRRDALVESLNRAGPSFSPGLGAQGNFLEPGFNARETVGQFDSQSVQTMKRQVEALNETLRETARARALAFSGEVKISSDADEAVRALLPYIDALKKVELQLNKIKAAQGKPLDRNDPLSAPGLTDAQRSQIKDDLAAGHSVKVTADEIITTFKQSSAAMAVAAQAASESSSGAKGRQGLGANNEEALRAAEVLKMNLKSTADETDRANSIALQLARSYGTSSIEVAKTRAALGDQLSVASAVGGQARLAAQEQATYNDLIRQGKSAEDASAIATQQRAVAQAQINSNAEETLFSLQNQAGLAAAVTGQEQIAAQYEATRNQLIHDGVDGYIAMQIASEQMAQSIAKVNAQVEQQVFSLQQQTDLIIARQNGTEAAVKAEQAYTNAIRAGADASQAAKLQAATLANEETKAWAANADAIAKARAELEAYLQKAKFIPFATGSVPGSYQLGKNVFEGPNGYTQFDPSGYESKVSTATATSLGGLGVNINQILAQGGSTLDAFSAALSGGVSKAAGKGLSTTLGGASATLDTDKVSTLERLIATMTREGQIGATQSLLDTLRGTAPSLERDEEIVKLTESLKQLTDATNQNTAATSAMTDVLSPLYSSDPRQTHLGFRAFGGGGIMTPWGEMPLHKYDGGGIATSPQVAIYAENRVPEAYVPVPSGRIPVEIRQPANTNQKIPDVKVFINVQGHADADTVAALKQTGFQQAQAMRRALSG